MEEERLFFLRVVTVVFSSIIISPTAVSRIPVLHMLYLVASHIFRSKEQRRIARKPFGLMPVLSPSRLSKYSPLGFEARKLMLGNEFRSIVTSFKLHTFLIIRSSLAVFELKKRGFGARKEQGGWSFRLIQVVINISRLKIWGRFYDASHDWILA